MSESLTLSPLLDEPVAPAPAPADASRPERLRAFVGSLLREADTEGFATVEVESLAKGLSDIMGYRYDVLSDAPWLLHDWLGRAEAVMAPDPTLERRRLKPGDVAVVYASDLAAPAIRHRPYKKALLLVKYLTLAFQPLSPDELAEAGRLVDSWVKDTRYRFHLRALLRWYNVRRRLLDKRTRLMHNQIVSPDDRRRLVDQLLRFAPARGQLDHKTLAKLERLMTLLGVHDNVNVLLHRLHFAAHPKPHAPLDKDFLSHVEGQTSSVRALLADVFDRPEPESESVSEPKADPFRETLDHLLEREVWSLEEVAALSPDIPPLLTLEKVNALATELVGDTIADVEGESVYVTTSYKQFLNNV